MERCYPELVSTDPEGYEGVTYDRLVAPLIEAVKERQRLLGNRLFYLLTRGHFEAPERLGELTEREKLVYTEVAAWMLQNPPIVMGGAMREEKLREYYERQLARKQDWLNSLPPEERLRGLGPEERLRGLGPSQLVQALTREGNVQALSEQDRQVLARLLNQGK